MKAQRLLVVLTVFNILLLVFSLSQTRAVVAEGVAPVLRGRALEIVDDRGRVRAPNVKLGATERGAGRARATDRALAPPPHSGPVSY